MLVLFNIVLSVKELTTLIEKTPPFRQSLEYEERGVEECYTLTPLIRGPGKVPPARVVLRKK
jgi:hypothetical protein